MNHRLYAMLAPLTFSLAFAAIQDPVRTQSGPALPARTRRSKFTKVSRTQRRRSAICDGRSRKRPPRGK